MNRRPGAGPVAIGDDQSWPHGGAVGDPIVKTPKFRRNAKLGDLRRIWMMKGSIVFSTRSRRGSRPLNGSGPLAHFPSPRLARNTGGATAGNENGGWAEIHMAPGISASTRPNVEDRTGEPDEAASLIDIQFSKSISGRLTIDFSKISAAVTDPASRCRDKDRASKVGIRRNDICEMCRRGRYGAMHRLFVFNDIWDHPLVAVWRSKLTGWSLCRCRRQSGSVAPTEAEPVEAG